MTYWRLALVVSFSAFALSSLALSAALSILYPAIARRTQRFSPRDRASALWQLRLAPAAAATVFAFGLVLPTFLVFEPRDTREAVSVTLAALGAAGSALLLAAVIRGLRAWAATRALERRWNGAAASWDAAAGMPVRLIEDDFPTVAVVGVASPRLYVARRVLAECPPRELRAMFAHEAAHVASRDNLKRFAMRLSPDVVWVRDALERAWSCAAEEAADAVATASADERLDLAQALLRVSRLAPSGPLTSPVSAFYLGGSIDARVRLLLDPDDAPSRARRWTWCAAGLSLAVAAACIVSAPAFHQLMETLVRVLP